MSNPEYAYLVQCQSWKEGMQYRYSPDFYPVNRNQYEQLMECGQLMGKYLNNQISENILEFRLDMVKDYQNRLWIMEVQTDDRGMPAMAIARNARGPSPLLPGLLESLNQSLISQTNKLNYSLAFIYPDEEYFYYAGLYDVRKILRCINPKNEILVSPLSETNQNGITLVTNPKMSGVKAYFEPDIIWDFSESISSPRIIQTKVDKNIILNPWAQSFSQSSTLEIQLRSYIPKTLIASDPETVFNKDELILKPASGRWSKGVVIGRNTDQLTWQKLALTNRNLIAQKFIDTPKEWLKVSDKNGGITKEPFIARIEPYFVKVYDQWILADILATCTKFQPIHGSRDCIMIPAEII